MVGHQPGIKARDGVLEKSALYHRDDITTNVLTPAQARDLPANALLPNQLSANNADLPARHLC